MSESLFHFAQTTGLFSWANIFSKRMENLTVLARSCDVKARATLVIKDFVDVMSKYSPGKSCSSDSFMVGDTPMAINVYPNGSIEQQRGYVSVSLWNKGRTNINVQF